MSLGRAFAGHSMEYKLDMAQKYGFRGIELFYEDLEYVAKVMPGQSSATKLLAAASQVRQWCDRRKLEIICLQPFMDFGGLLDREKQRQNLATIELWTELALTLGTDLILFPSSFLSVSRLSDDVAVLIKDFQDAADVGLKRTPTIRFAFEALCWGTRVSTWEDSWKIISAVNRPNFGLCVDTFNIAGQIFADPAAVDGCTRSADAAVEWSMERLMSHVDSSKIFLVQIADAERLERPLNENHTFYNVEQPARMSWSRNCRLFYGEEHLGGYLPVKRILQTVIHGLGYRGWMSFEVFHRKLTESDSTVPEYYAARASRSWTKIVRDLSLERKTPRREFYQGKERAVL